MASSAGSPSFSDSSGGSDLMALLDQELEIENVEAAEQDNASSAAETCQEPETCIDGRQNKRRRLESGTVQQQCPPHPGLMHGMCIRCGAEVSEPEQLGIPLRYLHLGLQVSSQEADRIRH
ncbi:hypothetical protein ABBQ32_009807 [Trebouxia sp. C0010 RCD-2024]